VEPTRPAAVWPGAARATSETSAVSERLAVSRSACASLMLTLPFKNARAHRLWVAVLLRSRRQITMGSTRDKSSAHLSPLAAWRVDNSNFPRVHRARLALSQVNALSRVRPDRGIPSISTGCPQVRRRCAQVIHMFVHKTAWRSLPPRSGSAHRCLRARAKHTRTRGPRPEA
jgi:hypothetical protein